MSKLAGVLDVNNILGVCQRRCSDFNISVRYDPHASTAMTDGKNIILPVVNQPITMKGLDILYGMVIHECGHHVRPKAFDILNNAKPPEHLCALYNIVEDDGMERDRANEWLGDCHALSRMNSHIIGDVGDSWKEHWDKLTPQQVDDQDPCPIAAMVLGQLSRLEWDDESGPKVRRLLLDLPEPIAKLVYELEDEGWVNRYRATTNEVDTWNLAVDLAKRLYPNNKEQEYEDIRQAGLDGAEGNGTPRDTSSDSMADSQSKGKGQDVETGAQPKGSEGTTVSWRDCVVSEHNEWKPKDDSVGNVGITWEGYVDSGGVAFMPLNEINVIDLSKKKGNYSAPGRFMPSVKASRSFANRIRRYIQAKGRIKVRRDRQHGKLDRGAMHKLAMPPVDKGEWNKKLFYDQTSAPMKDTAIFVLVDWSGSMGGHKMKYAADAAQRLIHTFDRVLRVPVAMAAFTNGESECDIGYVKKWNTRGVSPEEVARRLDHFCYYTSANNDGDAVNWAWNEIRKRKEKRKILIVLSDGAPAGSWQGHSTKTLATICSAIEKEGRVELYGVGICSEAVKNYYTNWKYLSDPSQINTTLFNLIKEGDNVKR